MANYEKPHSTLKDIPLAKMRVSGAAQRELRVARVDFLLSEFDIEMFGYPVVNFRDAHYWMIDGQHRIAALKAWLGEWQKQSVTCHTYSGMTEKQEADMFDRLQNKLSVGAFDKFKVRVTAGRETECAVKKVVESVGLKISTDNADESIGSVTTLVKIYEKTDGGNLARTLKICNDSFGGPGLITPIIDGMSRVCGRYNGALNDANAIETLRAMRGGFGQLMAKAGLLRNQTGTSLPECVAAAAVDIINRKRTRNNKLPSWWQEE